MRPSTRSLLAGLAFPEGPRWHGEKLWFSDMHDGVVRTVDASGRSEVVVRVEQDPSGLGWLPDGRLLVVSMRDRRLLRLDPDGRARVVADDLAFPNGCVITPDGGTLVVGETLGQRLTAFDIAADGSLTGRRTWAALDGLFPDGICLDAEGAIWVASPVGSGVFRIAEGGERLETIPVATRAFACMLGGPEGRTLHICTAETSHPTEAAAKRTGRIEVVEVAVPRAGLP